MVQQPSKTAVAQRLADAHYAIDPNIDLIIQLKAEAKREKDLAEPIKLLEINSSTLSAGIHPLFFGPHRSSGIIYPSVIIEITPDEFKDIRKNPSKLPNGWRLGSKFAKPTPAGRQ